MFGVGEQSRDFTYVANVVEANILGATQKIKTNNIILNCACNEQTTLNTLVKRINEINQSIIEPIYKEKRKGDVLHSYANIDFARKLFIVSSFYYTKFF